MDWARRREDHDCGRRELWAGRASTAGHGRGRWWSRASPRPRGGRVRGPAWHARPQRCEDPAALPGDVHAVEGAQARLPLAEVGGGGAGTGGSGRGVPAAWPGFVALPWQRLSGGVGGQGWGVAALSVHASGRVGPRDWRLPSGNPRGRPRGRLVAVTRSERGWRALRPDSRTLRPYVRSRRLL